MTTIQGIAGQILEENGFIADQTTVYITAQNILDEAKWTTDECPLDDLEALMDNAVNYMNAQANLNIPPLSGASESMTASMSRSEAPTFKAIVTLLIRSRIDRGPNTGVSSLSITTTIADPQYTVYKDMIETGLNRLKTTSPIFVEYLITNAVHLINLHAGTSIAALSGTPGTKSLTATDNEIIVVKLVASQFLQSHLAKKMGAFTITPAMQTSIDRLKHSEIAFFVEEDTSGTED